MYKKALQYFTKKLLFDIIYKNQLRRKNMNIKTLTNISILAIFTIIIAFFLSFTLSAPTQVQNISKIRIEGDTTYVIDSAQNTLFFGPSDNIMAHSITTRKEVNTDIPFNALLGVTALQNGTIFLIDGIADGVFQYDSNGEFVKEHTRFESGSSITNIIAITSDYNDNVYALQYNNGYNILSLGVTDEYFSIISTLSNDTLESLGVDAVDTALLACDFENQTFYIASNGTLLQVKENQAEVLCNYAGNATDIAVDYLGCPYLALDNGTILKYDNGINYLELSTNTFSLNFENGDITYIQNGNTISTFSSQFVNNLSSFQHPIDYTARENLTESAEIYNVTNNTDLFKYPLKISYLSEIASGTKVIKLADDNNYPQFTYILTTIDGVLTPCYIQTDAIEQIQDTELNTEMRTFTPNTRLYKYPTADSYINHEALYLTTISEATSVLVVGTACNYLDGQGRAFYEVIYNDKIYYVIQSMLTTLATEEGTITLNSTNAYLDSDEAVTIYAGVNSDNIVGIMPADARFYVNQNTFDNSIKRTYIEYLDENNNYITGFIDTDLIQFDEVSPFIILGAILLLVVLILILILILYFAKEHKKVKEQLNEKTAKNNNKQKF